MCGREKTLLASFARDSGLVCRPRAAVIRQSQAEEDEEKRHLLQRSLSCSPLPVCLCLWGGRRAGEKTVSSSSSARDSFASCLGASS